MPTRVVFLGQRRWARVLADLVSKHAPDVHVRAWAVDGLGRPPLLDLLQANILVRVGFRPGATTWRGVAFEIFWTLLCAINRKSRRVFYWIGSDVTSALQAHSESRVLSWSYTASSNDTHFAGAPWFVEELARIGIQAEEMLFPSPLDPALFGLHFPLEFRVLTYIPETRPEFYGSAFIVEAARRLPDVSFDIVGGTGSWARTQLPNLHFHGSVKAMVPLYAGAAVLVRLVPHDAVGATVREALAAGRHVIYSCELPYTMHLPYAQAARLCETIDLLRLQHTAGLLRLNAEGREYASREFGERRLVDRLVERLRELAELP